MGLRVWLPLNGSLENQGLSTLSITNSGAATDTAGKIGSCYSFDGSDDYISLTGQCFYNVIKGGPQPFSIAMWVYHADATRAILFGDYGLSGAINFNIELTTSHTLRFYWNASPDTTVSTASVGQNTWSHVTIVYDGSSLKFYINSDLKNTWSGTLATKIKTSGAYYLGRDSRTGTTVLNGKLNDFRLYDHALSVKEVRELARGLMVHYKLNQNGLGSTNLALNSRKLDISAAKTNTNIGRYSSPTLQARSDGFNEVYCTVNWYGIGIFANSLNLVVGEKYTYSFYIRGNGSTRAFSFYPMMFNSGGTRDTTSTLSISIDGGTFTSANSKTFGSKVITDPEYHYCTFEWNTTMANIISNGGNINLTIQLHGTWNSGDWACLYAPKLEKGSTPTAWAPAPSESGMTATRIADSSGFRYHGTAISTLTTTTDTPRYDCSTFFDATTSKIALPAIGFSGTSTTYTFAWWQYMVNTARMAWGFSDRNRLNVYYSNPICWNTGDGTSTPFQDGTTTINPSELLNAWHHIAVTGDGTAAKIYIDGVYRGTAKTWRAITGTQIYISGWDTGTNYNWVGGKLSDFRIYSTALTAADVADLYHTSAEIDRNGNYYSREVIEK